MSIYIDKPYSLKEFYDYDTFPESKGLGILSWKFFTRDFDSVDLKLTNEIKHICETHLEKLIDLRPYMIENPESVNKFDYLPKIHSRFLNLHLRHLIVTNPISGHLEGMITR